MKHNKRMMTLLLAGCMAASMVPSAAAADTDEPVSAAQEIRAEEPASAAQEIRAEEPASAAQDMQAEGTASAAQDMQAEEPASAAQDMQAEGTAGRIVTNDAWGTYGPNRSLKWTLTSGGTLTITGKGQVPDENPWESTNITVKHLVIGKGITSLYGSIFSGYASLESIKLPNSLTSIGYAAFSDCISLGEVVIPDSVVALGSRCFSGCISLRKVTLGNHLRTVGSYSFYECRSLQSVTFPNSVVTIGSEAFRDCTSLRYVKFGKGTAVIEDSAFYGCSALKTIYFAGDRPEMASWSFCGVDGAKVYYPKNNKTWKGPYLQSASNIIWKTWSPGAADLFNDVPANAWYTSAVQFVYSKGIMSGVSPTTFAPNANLTRAQVAQILYNQAGKPAVSGSAGFADVKSGAWYANAVNWAAKKGIVSGTGNRRFEPNGNITREQLAVMLYNKEGRPKVSGSFSRFADGGKVSGWAADGMLWATKRGIINGSKSGGELYLNPQSKATRAEAAAMMMKYLKK